MKILSAQPLRVERNGMPLAQFTDSIGVAQADQGWQYGAPFVLVKLNHAGGSARIVLQGNSSTR
jgi:hypothetical protein